MKFFLYAFYMLKAFALFGQDQTKYETDFDYLWQNINDNYAYFHKKTTDWQCVKNTYRPQIQGIKKHWEWVRLLENMLYELYDDHASLNTNLDNSRRLVPSGTDIWAEWQGEKAIITALRKGFGAEKCGLKVGMEITAFNGISVKIATANILPKCVVDKNDKDLQNWALRNLLAGTHDTKRIISIKINKAVIDFKPDEVVNANSIEHPSYKGMMDWRILDNNIGYIRINNCLFKTDLIRAFDTVLLSLQNTKALILDLRETASGGNNLVAGGILGRLIEKEIPYQKYLFPIDEKTQGVMTGNLDLAIPRKGWHYTKPMTVLVNRWTGSMGEGLAVGLDGIKRAFVIGTPMASLCGGTDGSLKLEKTGVSIIFPTTQIFHIDGSPREDFKPPYLVDLSKEKEGEDLILEKAVEILRKY